MSNDALGLLVLAGTLLVAFAGIAVFVFGSSRRAELVGRGSGAGDAERRPWVQALDSRLRRTRPGGRLSRWLSACGVPLTAGEFVVYVLAGAMVTSLFLTLFFVPTMAFVVGFVGSIVGARAWGERKRGQRTEAFIGQLSDLARTLSNGASAGLSIAGAIELTAREISEPARTELGIVVQQMRLGRSLSECLDDLSERLPSREVAVLVTTLAIQQRAGGDSVRALSELSETLQARKELRREVKTLLSGTVATSYVIAGLGFAAIIMMNVINPGVLRDMTSEPLGIAAFVVAGTLWAVGFLAIRQTTRIET